MMAKKPVIHAIDAANDMVSDSGCGLSVRPEDPHAIAGAVTRLYGMSEKERVEMGQKGYDHVRMHHTYPVLAEKFIEAMQA